MLGCSTPHPTRTRAAFFEATGIGLLLPPVTITRSQASALGKRLNAIDLALLQTDCGARVTSD